VHRPEPHIAGRVDQDFDAAASGRLPDPPRRADRLEIGHVERQRDDPAF